MTDRDELIARLTALSPSASEQEKRAIGDECLLARGWRVRNQDSPDLPTEWQYPGSQDCWFLVSDEDRPNPAIDLQASADWMVPEGCIMASVWQGDRTSPELMYSKPGAIVRPHYGNETAWAESGSIVLNALIPAAALPAASLKAEGAK